MSMMNKNNIKDWNVKEQIRSLKLEILDSIYNKHYYIVEEIEINYGAAVFEVTDCFTHKITKEQNIIDLCIHLFKYYYSEMEK